jgi:galactose mutarotase-like enzyme
MQSIRFRGQEYLWQGDPAYWEEHSPLLFPFVGRFTNDQYKYNQKTYHMTIHGFAKKSEFTVKELSETAITLTLTDSPETFESYPFHFVLDVNYTLTENQIRVSYQVQNRTDGTMYFAIGGHPGFQLPLEEGLSFTDYFLEFAQPAVPARVGHTPALYLSGVDTTFPLQEDTTLPLSHDLFDEDAIVLKNMANAVTLRSHKGTRSVTVSYPDLPYLGLWHAPKSEAPYLCIEPWTSLPSRQDIVEDFAFKSDMIRLREEETYHSLWSITLN